MYTSVDHLRCRRRSNANSILPFQNLLPADQFAISHPLLVDRCRQLERFQNYVVERSGKKGFLIESEPCRDTLAAAISSNIEEQVPLGAGQNP